MSGEETTRRRVLLGTGALAGLAGCASLSEVVPSSGESTTTRNHSTETPTETETATETEPSTTEAEDETTAGEEGPGYKESHWHGRLFFEIDGHLLDFTQPKYYLHNIEDDHPEAVYFHFHESAHGPNEWSNEKRIVTFQRALNLLPGIGYERQNGNHVVTYDGTTYNGGRSGTSIAIHRGTERIDPTTYEVEHNDNFWVRVQTGDGSTSASGERTGKLIVDVNNRRLDFGGEAYLEAGSDRFEFRDDGEPYRWYNPGEPVTLDRVLDVLPDLEYSQGSGGGHVVTYDAAEAFAGTYRDASDATRIIARQRTDPVDPTSYELRDGDIVWVYVHTSKAPDNEH